MKYYIFDLVYNGGYIEDAVEKYVSKQPSFDSLILDIDDELKARYTFDTIRYGKTYLYSEDVTITLQNIKQVTEEEYNILKEFNMKW